MAETLLRDPVVREAPPWLASYPEDIEWALKRTPEPLHTLLERAVARYAGHRYLEFLGRSWTYGEVGQLVARAVTGFRALGVERGVRVGLLLPNCPYFVICYFAVLRAGGTVVNYNPLYAPPELEHQVRESQTEIMVTMDLEMLLPKVVDLLGRTPLRLVVVGRMADVLPFPKNLLFPWLKRGVIAKAPGRRGCVWFSDLVASADDSAPAPVDPERDIAVLQYTGGTTGVPKAAVLTHANLHLNACQLEAWHPAAQRGAERILGILPLFHVFAMTTVLNYGTAVGGEIILVPRFDLTQVLSLIARRRPTIVPGVPTMYAAIRGHPHLERFDLSSIRVCISGGAPLPLEVKEGFERATGCTLVEGYGLTESPVVSCNPIGGRQKPGSIGLPLPGTTIEIVSLDDRATVLPPGEAGEICVRGPQVMAGYRAGLRPADETLEGARLHTGDVGYLDADGYCFIVDRLKDLIICSGYNVYPRVVEEAIYQHPAVAEAAVCGVPDEYRGQTVKAFVVRKEAAMLEAAELLRFLEGRISPIEMPKLVEFRDALPKSAVGKILKKELLRGQAGASAAA